MNLAFQAGLCKRKAAQKTGKHFTGNTTMKRFPALATLVAVLIWCGGAAAQELVHFPSLEDNGPGQPSTVLDGFLFRPQGDGRHKAIVGLHGCGGMFARATGLITPIYHAWAAEFTRQGYVFFLVDSFGPRHHGEMCSIPGFEIELYRKRPKDAYGALWFLQAQPFVRGDRIGLVGWSQGGGATLFSIAAQSLGRPSALPQGDFRAAVAFYPGACNEARQPAQWASSIPLLVLMGDADVWTPMAPCKTFLDGAIARGAKVETQVYPGAYHAFDAPNVLRRELQDYRTCAGVVRVPAFLARVLGN